MERLTELCGKHVELASQRTLRAIDDDEMDRRALVFDRLARGFRMTIILEARLDRDRRSAARETPANEVNPAPRLRVASTTPRPYVERERESETETESEIEDEALDDAVLRRMEDLEDYLEDDDLDVAETVATEVSASAANVPPAATPRAATPITPRPHQAHPQRRWAGSG